MAELRELSADQVLAASGGQRGVVWPIIDGRVIPDDQYKLYEAGRDNDTPILVGYNSDEGLSFMREDTTQAFIEAVRQRYGPFAERLLKLYPPGEATIRKTARDLIRDAAFGWHTWAWARLQSKTSDSRVFYYYFDQHPEYPAGSPREGQGTTLCADVPFVFETPDVPLNRQEAPGARKLSETMAAYWTNFAKSGDPNGEGLPNWPAFSDSAHVVKYLKQPPHTGSVPSEDGLRGLEEYFAWRRTPEGEAAVQPDAPAAGVGGHSYSIATKRSVFDGAGVMTTAPEWDIWTEITLENDLQFIELPGDLLARLAREGEAELGTFPVGLYPGVECSIPTIARTGTVVYGRADMPDDFAYMVAKAIDEQQHLLQWKHLNFSYSVHNVWKAYEVPLHPGAARYYRERAYMKYVLQTPGGRI